MAKWYCIVNEQRYGPVEEAELRAWVAEGRVVAATMVWQEGMADWVAAGTVPGLIVGTGATPPPPPPGGPSVQGAATAGTGGRTENRELMARAHGLLRGAWGLPIGFCLLLGILQSGAGIPYIGALASLIVAGPFVLGSAVFFLTLARKGRTDMAMLFAGFKNFGSALGLYWLMAIFVWLWTLLLIVPGIIASLAYSQAYYILAENPSIGAMEALRRSKAMMQGYKGKLCLMYLRFLGWGILCIFTLCIGFLWLSPYMAASLACFHEDMKDPDGEAASSGGEQSAYRQAVS